MRKFCLFLILIVSGTMLSACGKTHYQFDSYIDSDNSRHFLLEVGQTHEYDMTEILKDIETAYDKYELVNSRNASVFPDEIVSIYKNTIKAINPGRTLVSIRLYNKESVKYKLFILGYVSVADPTVKIEVRTPEDLASMKDDLSGYYELKNDIDLNDYGDWEPIDSNERRFTGTFINPAGFKIKNLKTDNTYESTGLFFVLENAYIDGTILENVHISSWTKNYLISYAGGLSAEIYNSTVKNCKVSGLVSGENRAGGFVGYNSKSFFINCEFSGSIESREYDIQADTTVFCAGGIAASSYTYAGYDNGGYMNCKVEAEINSVSIAGLGSGHDFLYDRCMFMGAINAPIFGTLVGSSTRGSLGIE